MVPSKPARFCSRACARVVRVRAHLAKRGGKPGGLNLHVDGYLYRYFPEHPHANRAGGIKEHRLVMEQMLGRYLAPWEQVHHKDGNKTNNAPENLELWNRYHPTGVQAINGMKHCPTCTCFECGKD